jgi:hypothetical protein
MTRYCYIDGCDWQPLWTNEALSSVPALSADRSLSPQLRAAVKESTDHAAAHHLLEWMAQTTKLRAQLLGQTGDEEDRHLQEVRNAVGADRPIGRGLRR